MRSRLVASAILLAGFLACALPAQAAETPGLQISVEPLTVQFSLAPGGQASAPVTIRNVGTDAAIIIAQQIDWRTLLDGSVRTERPGTEGSSSINPHLRLSATEFTLAPGETRRLTLALVLPTLFPAVPRDYWGGYFIRATPAGRPSTSSFGVGANILTYETMGAPERHLKLTDLKVADSGNHTVKFTARLLSVGHTFVRPQIRYTIAQGGRVLQQHDDSTPAIFGGAPRLFERTLADLVPGTYQLELTIDYGGETLISGSTNFTVR